MAIVSTRPLLEGLDGDAEPLPPVVFDAKGSLRPVNKPCKSCAEHTAEIARLRAIIKDMESVTRNATVTPKVKIVTLDVTRNANAERQARYRAKKNGKTNS
jgi:hypothetical protein